jgi:mannose-6-phosphate isomerase
MPWGGTGLARRFGVPGRADEPVCDEPVGEAWLVSDHALHSSTVAAGPLAGTTLRQLMAERAAEMLGRPAGRFPLLVKVLDAREDLSVQVHPDDELARTWAAGEGGKTEAWVIEEADAGAALYLGLKPGFDKAALARELLAGTAPLCLRRYEPRPGECYFVPAGAVHALGAGLVLLEVQQTSDATFRLYDWGRVDAAGRPRPLHLEAGLACVKEAPPGAGPRPPGPERDGWRELVTCPFFSIHSAPLAGPTAFRGPCILRLHGPVRFDHPALDGMTVDERQAVFIPAGLVTEAVPIGTCRVERIDFPPQ